MKELKRQSIYSHSELKREKKNFLEIIIKKI